ncbi:helix-turn-helix domain-containing protein [Bradyrhizobium ottawaense]|uniref:helix-turn-helix domain-containing protein n=1 Tax=Bradyrhizobium ottawaense TaxID=931866 RepID=UPI0030F43025
MLLDVLHGIFLLRYAGTTPQRFGAALELMMVSMMVSVTTRDKKTLTASGLAKKLRMPRSNVDRHLKRLMEEGAVRVVKRRYCADLDLLDGFITREILDRNIDLIEQCVKELKRLRVSLHNTLA